MSVLPARLTDCLLWPSVNDTLWVGVVCATNTILRDIDSRKIRMAQHQDEFGEHQQSELEDAIEDRYIAGFITRLAATNTGLVPDSKPPTPYYPNSDDPSPWLQHEPSPLLDSSAWQYDVSGSSTVVNEQLQVLTSPETTHQPSLDHRGWPYVVDVSVDPLVGGLEGNTQTHWQLWPELAENTDNVLLPMSAAATDQSPNNVDSSHSREVSINPSNAVIVFKNNLDATTTGIHGRARRKVPKASPRMVQSKQRKKALKSVSTYCD